MADDYVTVIDMPVVGGLLGATAGQLSHGFSISAPACRARVSLPLAGSVLSRAPSSSLRSLPEMNVGWCFEALLWPITTWLQAKKNRQLRRPYCRRSMSNVKVARITGRLSSRTSIAR